MGRGRNADATGQKRYKYVGSEYEIQSHTTHDTRLLPTEAYLSSSFGTLGVPCGLSESFHSMPSLLWHLEKRTTHMSQGDRSTLVLGSESKLR